MINNQGNTCLQELALSLHSKKKRQKEKKRSKRKGDLNADIVYCLLPDSIWSLLWSFVTIPTVTRHRVDEKSEYAQALWPNYICCVQSAVSGFEKRSLFPVLIHLVEKGKGIRYKNAAHAVMTDHAGGQKQVWMFQSSSLGSCTPQAQTLHVSLSIFKANRCWAAYRNLLREAKEP